MILPSVADGVYGSWKLADVRYCAELSLVVHAKIQVLKVPQRMHVIQWSVGILALGQQGCGLPAGCHCHLITDMI
jgi:hypothetical protein